MGKFTNQERWVVRQLAEGQSQSGIARCLGISRQRVGRIVARVGEKMGRPVVPRVRTMDPAILDQIPPDQIKAMA